MTLLMLSARARSQLYSSGRLRDSMNPSKDTERNEAMLESTKPRGGEPGQCPEAKLAQILTAGDVLDVMKMSRLDMQSRSRSYRKKLGDILSDD